MKTRILIDTGPLVAILDAADARHAVCAEQLNQIRVPLVTCWPVITEAAWLLRQTPRAIPALLASFTPGRFELAQLGGEDFPALTGILDKYKDLGVQLADAALLHLANREGIDTIFTLDKRDFGVMRLARGRKIRMIP